MAGKVAVLNDLAGFGRCSLTAAISVLSAMGVQPCPLPTAVLSAQTGFESYFFQDLTEQMGMITEEWKKSGAQFDGIVTGFMSDHRQIGEVNHFLDLFHKEGTFLLVDPVLGDNGKRFSVFDGLFQKEMKQLVKRADIVTPNVTELCLLTDYDYDKIQNISETGDREALFLEVSKAAGRLLDSGVSEVIVTGVLFEEQDAAKECTVGKETGTGGRKVANLTVTREKTTAGISRKNALFQSAPGCRHETYLLPFFSSFLAIMTAQSLTHQASAAIYAKKHPKQWLVQNASTHFHLSFHYVVKPA